MVRRRAPKRRLAGKRLTPTQKKEVKNLIGHEVEFKNDDDYLAASNIPSGNGVIIGPFANPAQGLNEDERIGNQIKLKDFELRITLTMAAGDITNQIRLIVFRWYVDNNIDVPSGTDLLSDIANNPWLSPINDRSIESGKIHIMHDKLYSFSATGSQSRSLSFKFFGRKLGRKVITFTNTSIQGSGQIYVAATSDSVAVSHPLIALYTRTNYSDA